MVSVPRRGFLKGLFAAAVASSIGLSMQLVTPPRRAEAATLTVDSLSITPGVSLPIDSAVGIVAAQTWDRTGLDKHIRLIDDGVSLPSSSTSGTWTGTPSVQTDFSP